MLRIAAAALGLFALFAAGPALARDCVIGWITHVDQMNDTITLDSGVILHVSEDINLEDISEGVHVKLVVMQSAQGREAVSIAPAAAPQRPAQSRAGRV